MIDKYAIDAGCQHVDAGGDGRLGHHQYADQTCPKCGQVFCYSCCGSTNVDQGGKYEPDYMTCPNCGHDIYED